MNSHEKSPFRIRGWRDVDILFLGGYEIKIVSRFFATNKTRSQKGKGFHPGLALLGISERLSPATLDLLAPYLLNRAAASLGSMRDAQTALVDQGIAVSITRISTAVRAVALRSRSLRTKNQSLQTIEIQGRRIVVSVDGGRLRTRENKNGKKTDKNRTRYSTDWREPKLLCIYFLDENGDVDRSIPPVLDGMTEHVDTIFGFCVDI